ncbi:MAG: STAS domain-containing protein, partial [Deferrisomatales bacterium]
MEPCTLTPRAQGPTTAIAVDGRFDGRAQEPLFAAWAEAGGRPVLLDFAGASGLDGAGLALLAWLAVRAGREGRELAAGGLGPRCRQVLATHLGGLLARREPAPGGPAAASPAEQWAGPQG